VKFEFCFLNCVDKEHAFYEALTAWGTVGAAIATFLAVVVALLVARADRRVSGKGAMSIVLYLFPPAPPEQVLRLHVTNVGARPFLVTSFGVGPRWRFVKRLRIFPHYLYLPWTNPKATGVPKSISPDETADIGTNSMTISLRRISEAIARSPLPVWITIKAIRPYAYTPRDTIWLKFDEDVQARLLAGAKRLRSRAVTRRSSP